MTVDHELYADTLPTYLSRFIGRERELGELARLVSGARQITICGVGGAGKTRLAIELAKRLRRSGPAGIDEAAFWVPLEAVSDPEDVVAAVGAGMGLRGPRGSEAVRALTQALGTRRVLVVLDACEHLSGACRDVLEPLLEGCPRLTVIATSRAPLRLRAELVYPAPPMGAEALELFADRAASAAPAYALTDHNSESIAAICRRLDGLPLAVELAAGWIPVLAPADLLARLDRILDAAPGSDAVAERHRSMVAVLDGTWEWLGEEDQRILTALGVFVGGFRLEAAEAVAGATLASLATLVERSLIQRLPDAAGGSRYHVHELVRASALRRLEAAAGRAAGVRARHFDHYLHLAQSWDTANHTTIEPAWDGPLAAEQGNLELARSWALARGDAERALQLAEAMDAFWVFSTPRTSTRREHLDRALAIHWTDSRPHGVRTRAKALCRLGHMSVDTHPERARGLFHEALTLFSEVDDQVGVAASLRGIGHAHLIGGDLDAASRYQQESLVIESAVGDDQGQAWSLLSLSAVALGQGCLDRARHQLDEALARFLGNEAVFGAFRAHALLGELHRQEQDWQASIACYRSALRLQQRHHFTADGADLLEGLALLAGSMREVPAAARLAGAAATWRAAHEEPRHIQHQDAGALMERLRGGHDHGWDLAFAAGEGLTAAGAANLAEQVLAGLEAALLAARTGLTARELDVLRLVAEGLSSSDTARSLGLSPRTVHAHLRSIFDKLGVSSRTAAAREAVRLHLV